jgi:hypothetical protein
MSVPDAPAYETLARSLERELELIGQGAVDGLAALHAERAALLESLPAVPPAAARPALERAALMNKRLEIEILRRQEALIVESANVERVERTARGYTPPVDSRPHVQATA